MDNKIHFIITGGTIDKMYDPVSQSNILNQASAIPFLVEERVKAEFEYAFETICLLDSNDLTTAHRELMLQSILQTDTNHIVITHGTDTMEVTSNYLKENLPDDHGKTIVLTGSLVPIANFINSDAGFNLGFSVATSLLSAPGVYVCMHGRIFNAGEVRKNLKIARFEKT